MLGVRSAARENGAKKLAKNFGKNPISREKFDKKFGKKSGENFAKISRKNLLKKAKNSRENVGKNSGKNLEKNSRKVPKISRVQNVIFAENSAQKTRKFGFFKNSKTQNSRKKSSKNFAKIFVISLAIFAAIFVLWLNFAPKNAKTAQAQSAQDFAQNSYKFARTFGENDIEPADSGGHEIYYSRRIQTDGAGNIYRISAFADSDDDASLLTAECDQRRMVMNFQKYSPDGEFVKNISLTVSCESNSGVADFSAGKFIQHEHFYSFPWTVDEDGNFFVGDAWKWDNWGDPNPYLAAKFSPDGGMPTQFIGDMYDENNMSVIYDGEIWNIKLHPYVSYEYSTDISVKNGRLATTSIDSEIYRDDEDGDGDRLTADVLGFSVNLSGDDVRALGVFDVRNYGEEETYNWMSAYNIAYLSEGNLAVAGRLQKAGQTSWDSVWKMNDAKTAPITPVFKSPDDGYFGEHLAADAQGNYYIIREINCAGDGNSACDFAVEKYSASGKFMTQFAIIEKDSKKLVQGLAVSRDGKTVYVAESDGKIYAFRAVLPYEFNPEISADDEKCVAPTLTKPQILDAPSTGI